MKVAYVGNLSDDDLSPPHSTENHVKQAFRNLGHEVVPIQERGLDWTEIPSFVEGADLFLWTRTAGFDPSDLSVQTRALKSLAIPKVGFHLDRWWGLNREPDIVRSPFFQLDWLFTADGGHDEQWKEAGINHVWSPPAILSDEAKRVGNPRRDYAADVGFVGNLRKYGHAEWAPYRLKLLRFLSTTYRGRFKLWEGGIRGQDLSDLYASVKVLVGDSCLAGGATAYLSDRIPESLGRGAFLIHPRVERVTDGTLYQDGQHLACYDLGSFDELRDKIDHFVALEADRLDIAASGQAHVLENHTYELRVERLLATVLG